MYNVDTLYIRKREKKKIEVKTKINKMLNSKNEKFAVQFSTVKHECVVPYTLYINGTALPRQNTKDLGQQMLKILMR